MYLAGTPKELYLMDITLVVCDRTGAVTKKGPWMMLESVFTVKE